MFPLNVSKGDLVILNFEITKHLTKDQLSKHLNIIQDSDDLQYGINSVILKDLPQCKILFDKTNLIERVSF